MFAKLHLLSQDTPEGGGGLRWRPHPYLRLAGAVPKGPAVFDWSARQRDDLEALWRDPASGGARERLAKDLAAFSDKLGWAPEAEMLEDAEKHGDEYLVTLSAVPPELYVLPWEVIQVGASGTYLSDYTSAQVRYAVPGLEPREIQGVPPRPGVLFAWSGAGGAVPHEEQAAAIRAAAEAGGATFHELAEVDEASLQAALDAGPPSVLHLLCHGIPGPEGEPPQLTWGASDSPSEITATELARMLRRHHGSIRLVVLSACGSGDGHRDPLFMTSLAQELHKKGIPSVVASRYPLSVPGSRVMTRVLYDKMLREAWSLERALRHTREALFRVDDDGETHPGDAYGIQLYAYDRERFISDNNVEAERPVLASYPFGTPARPVPASGPPAAELTLGLGADPALSEDQLVEKLRRLSEDESLNIAIRLPSGKGTLWLSVHTTVDGAQRLLGFWRSKALRVAVGVVVVELILTKGILPAFAGTVPAAAAKAGKAAKVVKAAKVGRAIKETSQPLVSSGKALVMPGQAGAAVGQGAVVSAGKATMTALAIAGKAVTLKLAAVALVSSAAVAGSALVYRAHTQSAAQIALTSVRDQTATDRPGYDSEPPPSLIESGSPSPELGSPPPRLAGSPPPPPRPTITPSSEPRAPEPPTFTTTAEPPPPSAPTSTTTTPTAELPPPASELPTQAATAMTTTSTVPTPAPAGSEPTPAMAQPASGDNRPGAPKEDIASNEDRARAATGRTGSVEDSACADEPGPAGAGSRERTTACAKDLGRTPPPPAHAACGNAIVEPGEQCDDGNTNDGDGCSSRCMTESPRLPVAVEPSVLQGQQISGNSNVQPSQETRAAMARDGLSNLRGTVMLCVNTSGVVTAATMTEPTGYKEYDEKIVATVYGWRYHQFVINGTPSSVCSRAEFFYIPK